MRKPNTSSRLRSRAARASFGVALAFAVPASRGQSIFDSDSKRPHVDTPATQPASPPVIPFTPRPAASVPIDHEPASAPVHLKPVPDRDALVTSESEIESQHAAELRAALPADHKRLAMSLLVEAAGADAGSPEQFALYDEAIKSAVAASNLRLAFVAIDSVSAEFTCDPMSLKAKAVLAVTRGASPLTLSSISNVEAMLSLADLSFASDDFRDLAQVELNLKKALPTIAEPDLKIEVRDHLHSMEAARQAHEKIVPVLAKLVQSPLDPAANLAVGRYRCFVCGQWQQGLSLLARSGDARLAKLASEELAQRDNHAHLLQLGDRWQVVSTTLAKLEQPQVTQHAADLYRRAEEDLASDDIGPIESRLARIPSPPRYSRVDLVDVFDPAASVQAGDWRVKNSELDVAPSNHAKLEFAYEPPAEYNFLVSFTIVTPDTDAISTLASAGGHQFAYHLGAWGNTLAGFEMVGGSDVQANASTVRAEKWLVGGQHYVSLLKVRRTGVEGYLDGRLISSLKTDYSDLTPNNAWTLPRPTSVGLGATTSGVRFDRVEIIEITGKGKYLIP